MKEIKWAVLGTGVIANQMAQALIKNGKIFILLQTAHTKRLLILPKNIISEKYMTI